MSIWTNRVCFNMSRSKLIWISMTVFSWIGGAIPVMLGDSMFSLVSVLATTLGGLFGIWFALQIAKAQDMS